MTRVPVRAKFPDAWSKNPAPRYGETKAIPPILCCKRLNGLRFTLSSSGAGPGLPFLIRNLYLKPAT
jgi:hypothetical protein